MLYKDCGNMPADTTANRKMTIAVRSGEIELKSLEFKS
jgi:hypothetical protein